MKATNFVTISYTRMCLPYESETLIVKFDNNDELLEKNKTLDKSCIDLKEENRIKD